MATLNHARAERLQYYTYDVFTTSVFTGNQLAVVHVPAGTSITQETRQAIAAEFNYSETVIISIPADTSSDVPTFNVQIFLVDQEIPLAGHPVIGTAAHIFANHVPRGTTRAVLSTKAGLCATNLSPDGQITAAMPQDLHFHSFKFDAQALVAQQPGLKGWAGQASSTTVTLVPGMSFVCVQLPNLEALAAVSLFSPAFDVALLDQGWDHGFVGMMFYVVVSEAGEHIGLRTRMVEGRFEDAATGSASCALGCVLALQGRGKRFDMVQGVEMGRRSEIGVQVELEQGKVARVELRGQAVEVMQGSLRVPGQG